MNNSINPKEDNFISLDKIADEIRQSLPKETVKGKKDDTGKADHTLIPIEALDAMAYAFMDGAKRYGEFNYRNGIELRRLLGASLRHINKFLSKGTYDVDSKQNHLNHALASLAMAMFMYQNRPDLDNRPEDIKDKES
jgi:Domain of unknown function (DUF5664)